ncbi:MAG TPA: HEAT repeat domain-containing protein, partial [Terrimicrobiaceae bacterium]|nr:HEAT repeat domain-containing protein [Terrimicrobiaceae bacterium]
MNTTKTPTKAHYQMLRTLSCARLWEEEVPRFDRASPRERMDQVAIVRAVGTVFAESGSEAEKQSARNWLHRLLKDPQEKIRRYAMAALPKIGATEQDEAALLELLETASSDREKASVAETLGKIGGAATLQSGFGETFAPLERTRQKVEGNLARAANPGTVRFDRMLSAPGPVRIHLRCRSGLESLVANEVREAKGPGAKFRNPAIAHGCVAVTAEEPFSLADVYALRCFSEASLVLGSVESAGPDIPVEKLARVVTSPAATAIFEAFTEGPIRYRLVLGSVESAGPDIPVEKLARVVTSPAATAIFEAFTEGPIRYRLDFVSRGHQRAAVRALTDRVYALCPRLINDSRGAPWTINIPHTARGFSVELSPRGTLDPRFQYRRKDIPAASHPPLAACMVRLAGAVAEETAWDPFCGSGLELIERVLQGGVSRIFGTDLSAEAIAIAKENFAAALPAPVPSVFARCDFRDHAKIAGLHPGGISLVITNPPMGRRVPIPNLDQLIAELFAAAEAVLKPGGRLVFANPLPVKPKGSALKLSFREKIDLGGFHCHLEKYVKRRSAGSAHPMASVYPGL